MPAYRDDDATIAAASTPSPAAAAKRFAPGSIIAGRYRVVALLGKGGMGEVYRAEDLTLDHPVALKFLPDESGVAADPARLAQFHQELRVARQVSHKNVCRLYDLGEADGRRFLTMEYVDGEDLASLLRRIGRLPQDKAIDIARQICAGLAAAHERGVLHRDLKPANIMLDGDGNVRITDFGLAVAAGDATAELAGTPQYMAPELLAPGAGAGVARATLKSDIYALGLVLFEIFTGRRAYDAKTLRELKQFHESGQMTTPSSIVRDLDPAVERVIMRSLDRDPARRPASALAVAAALPGSDPLGAALAAGETPSPDMLVAAAESDALPVLRGVALVAILLASIAIYAVVSPRATLADLVPLDKPPAVLADRAQQMIADFGYTDRPTDSAHNFRIAPDFPRWLVDTDPSVNRWNPSRVASGPALLFWYRTSPRDIEPDSPSWEVSPTDPAMTISGETLVIMDTTGRLVEFHRVPPQREESPPAPPAAPKWSAVFQAAGLDQRAFTTVEPQWTPRDFADVRAAWEGPSPRDANIRLRVEAAAYRGNVVSVYVLGPWARPTAQQPIVPSTTDRVLRAIGLAFWWTVLAGSVFLARQNIRAGRADRRSASRVALLCLAMLIAAWMLGGQHRSSAPEEVNSFFRVLGNMLLQVGILWLLYVAVEPYGRRFWPDGLLGWTRLFSGHVRDPRIGREILIGSALGGALIVNDLARATAPYAIGRPPGIPALGEAVATLNGPGSIAIVWAEASYASVQSALLVAMFFVGLRLLVRRTWSAVAIGLVVLTGAVMTSARPGDVLWLYLIFQMIAIGLITFAIFRFGLLVTAIMLIVDNIPTAVPFAAHGPSWAAFPSQLSAALVIVLACFGFYAARAGQPVFGSVEIKN